jgi:hypothetical protein
MRSGLSIMPSPLRLRGGKLVPKPTGYEHKKLTPRYPASARLRQPNFPPPFERISDPQILRTRLNYERMYSEGIA